MAACYAVLTLPLLLVLLQYQATVLHDRDVLKDPELVARLLERNADPNGFDKDGVPPLHYAMQSGTKEVVEMLVAAGTNLNIPDASGATFLNVMVGRGNVEMTRLLLDQGASPKIPGSNGSTPLHVVAALGNGSEFVEIAELLIERGADPLKLNQQMQTPGQLHVGWLRTPSASHQATQLAADGSRTMGDVLQVQIPAGGFAPTAAFPSLVTKAASKIYTRGGNKFGRDAAPAAKPFGGPTPRHTPGTATWPII